MWACTLLSLSLGEDPGKIEFAESGLWKHLYNCRLPEIETMVECSGSSGNPPNKTLNNSNCLQTVLPPSRSKLVFGLISRLQTSYLHSSLHWLSCHAWTCFVSWLILEMWNWAGHWLKLDLAITTYSTDRLLSMTITWYQLRCCKAHPTNIRIQCPPRGTIHLKVNIVSLSELIHGDSKTKCM
jgi:hypothetical protein